MQAVHSGADLESAITNCLGYRAEVVSITSWNSSTQCVFLAFDRTLILSRGKASWLEYK